MVAISIIIISYNTKELTLECIDSVMKNYKEEFKDKKYELIVVDNASSDGTVQAIKKLKSSYITLIANEENVGFSRANNQAAKIAKGEYLFFLNSDCIIQNSGLVNLLNFARTNVRVGVVGAKLYNEDKTDQLSTGKFYTIGNLLGMLFGIEKYLDIRKSPQKSEVVDWVSGAAMLVKSETFKRVGGFDEKMFMYMEDMELCFRIKKIGEVTYFLPDLHIIHKSHGSSNRTFAIVSIFKGVLYFYKKHANRIEYGCAKLLLLLKGYVSICIGNITNNTYLTSTYKKAIQF